MVKNHQHGAIGSVKHGSGEHLRDNKRPRVEDETEQDEIGQAGSCSADGDIQAAPLATEHLDMTERGMTVEEFRAFARTLADPAQCRLTTLDLKHMGFGSVCAQLLGAALATNHSLTRLNADRNGLGLAGGKALGAALARNTRLASLEMSLNDIATEGGAAIAAALRTNASLTELTMKLHNKLPGIVWEAQRQAARQRPLSESSFASDVRARDDAEPHAPVAAPAPLAMRIGVPA